MALTNSQTRSRALQYILSDCTYPRPLLPDWTCWTRWSSVTLGEKTVKTERERDSLNPDLESQCRKPKHSFTYTFPNKEA